MSDARVIEASRIGDGRVTRWLVPSSGDAIRHSRDTFGSQFDPVERRVLEGGQPMIWAQVTPAPDGGATDTTKEN